MCGGCRTVINTTNPCVWNKCSAFMCFGGVALKGVGEIFGVGYVQTQAKIASFAKHTYPAFKRHNLRDIITEKVK